MSPVKPARKRDRDATRTRIVDAARDLFVEQGYARTTIASRPSMSPLLKPRSITVRQICSFVAVVDVSTVMAGTSLLELDSS